MNENNGPAVLAEGLVKHYDGREGAVEAVRGVDLEVRNGEIFGFLGPNGAGKSTTVRMLTTLLTITAGRSASRCRRPASTPARPDASSCSCTGDCSGSTPRRPPSARESCWRSSSSRRPRTA
jgi:ABC-type uncharacterized transport system ATPase subunit